MARNDRSRSLRPRRADRLRAQAQRRPWCGVVRLRQAVGFFNYWVPPSEVFSLGSLPREEAVFQTAGSSCSSRCREAERGWKEPPGIVTACGRPVIGSCGRTRSSTAFISGCCATSSAWRKVKQVGLAKTFEISFARPGPVVVSSNIDQGCSDLFVSYRVAMTLASVSARQTEPRTSGAVRKRVGSGPPVYTIQNADTEP